MFFFHFFHRTHVAHVCVPRGHFQQLSWTLNMVQNDAKINIKPRNMVKVLTLCTVSGTLKSLPPCSRKPQGVERASRCNCTWVSLNDPDIPCSLSRSARYTPMMRTTLVVGGPAACLLATLPARLRRLAARGAAVDVDCSKFG